MLLDSNGELPEVNAWLTKLECRKLQHWEMEQAVVAACGGKCRASKGKESLKRKAEVVSAERGQGCELGQQGSSNCRFKGELGDVGCRVEIDDLTSEDQCVVKIAIRGLSACTHSKVEELDACSTCMPQRKRALRDWCVKRKHKAKTTGNT